MASVGRATVLLASGTMVSRVLGFAKAWLLVQAIGTIGFGADAYATSTLVPNSIYAIIAQGVLSAILVPQIVRAASHVDGGKGYINKLVTVGIVVLAAVAIVATLLAPPLMAAFGLRGDQLTLGVAFAYWSLPQIFFLGLYTLLGEVLNARKSFGPFTWAPALNNVVGIAMLAVFIAVFGAHPYGEGFALADWPPGKVALLAGGATLGIAVQAVVLFLFWRRVGLSFRFDFAWRGVELGRAGRAAGWTLAMVGCAQLAGLIETNVANSASGGHASVQTMATAWLVFMLPHSIIAVSLVTAYYTRMAEHATTGDLVSFRADFETAVRSIVLLVGFCAAALIVVAYPFARVFTPAYASMGDVLIAYLVGLVPFAFVFVAQRAFYSLGDTRTPFAFTLAQTLVVVIGVLGCLALPAAVRATGIAAAVSLGSIVQAVIAAALLRRRIGTIGGRAIVRTAGRTIAAGLAAMVVGAVVLVLLGGTPYRPGFGVAAPAPAIAVIAIVGVVMLAVYGGALLALRAPELEVLRRVRAPARRTDASE